MREPCGLEPDVPDSLIMKWTTKSNATVDEDGPLHKAAKARGKREDWVTEFNTLALIQYLITEADGALDAGDRERCAQTIARLYSLLDSQLERRSCSRRSTGRYENGAEATLDRSQSGNLACTSSG